MRLNIQTWGVIFGILNFNFVTLFNIFFPLKLYFFVLHYDNAFIKVFRRETNKQFC